MIDVREEMANAPIGRYHCLVAVLIWMVVFFDGYDTFNPAYVIHYVMKPWHLLPSQAGFLVSSGLVGFMIGSLVQGKFSDRYGRRTVLLVALWIATIFSLATAVFANSFWSFFCGFRLLTGIGLGALLPIGITYVNEYAPRRLANTFSTWSWAFGWATGGIVASAVGIFLTPTLGWQALYYAASFSILLAVACHGVLPESLQFEAMRGQTGRIAATLSRLNPSRASLYASPGIEFIFPEPRDRAASISLLLSERYRRTTLAVWTAAFCILFGIFGLTGWVPTAMMQRGETFAVSFGFGALIQLMAFIGSLVCGFFADRSGANRAAMVIWWLGGAISVGTLALVNIHALNVIFVAAAGFGILGGQNILNNFTAASYDTEVRGTAVGMMLGVGRLGGVLGPYVTGWLLQFHMGSSGLFVAISTSVLLGACAILFARPGRSLQVHGTEAVVAQ
jgi:MFS family permease